MRKKKQEQGKSQEEGSKKAQYRRDKTRPGKGKGKRKRNRNMMSENKRGKIKWEDRKGDEIEGKRAYLRVRRRELGGVRRIWERRGENGGRSSTRRKIEKRRRDCGKKDTLTI